MFADLAKPEYKNCLVACEFWFTYKHREAFSRLQKAGECTNAGLIYTWPAPIKFFKAYGHRVVDKPIVWVTPEAIEGVQRVRLDVDAKFLKGYGNLVSLTFSEILVDILHYILIHYLLKEIIDIEFRTAIHDTFYLGKELTEVHIQGLCYIIKRHPLVYALDYLHLLQRVLGNSLHTNILWTYNLIVLTMLADNIAELLSVTLCLALTYTLNIL